MGFGVQVAVMDRCLQKDPTARPTAEEVMWLWSKCRTFLCISFTHLNELECFNRNGPESFGFAFDLNPSHLDLHLMWFSVCSGVQRAWWSDMLSLVETPRDHPTHTPKRLATVMKNPSFLVKSRFKSTKFRSLRSLSSLQEIDYRWLLTNSPSGAVFEVETRQTCLVFNCQSKDLWKAFQLNWGMNFEEVQSSGTQKFS